LVLSKKEKILSTFIKYAYLGSIAGLFIGAIFGGRGGMLFFYLGFYLGCGLGIVKSLYLAKVYDPSADTEKEAPTKAKRGFILFLYVFLIYTIIMEILYPVKW
jgi:hypothetical protein